VLITAGKVAIFPTRQSHDFSSPDSLSAFTFFLTFLQTYLNIPTYPDFQKKWTPPPSSSTSMQPSQTLLQPWTRNACKTITHTDANATTFDPTFLSQHTMAWYTDIIIESVTSAGQVRTTAYSTLASASHLRWPAAEPNHQTAVLRSAAKQHRLQQLQSSVAACREHTTQTRCTLAVRYRQPSSTRKRETWLCCRETSSAGRAAYTASEWTGHPPTTVTEFIHLRIYFRSSGFLGRSGMVTFGWCVVQGQESEISARIRAKWLEKDFTFYQAIHDLTASSSEVSNWMGTRNKKKTDSAHTIHRCSEERTILPAPTIVIILLAAADYSGMVTVWNIAQQCANSAEFTNNLT